MFGRIRAESRLLEKLTDNVWARRSGNKNIAAIMVFFEPPKPIWAHRTRPASRQALANWRETPSSVVRLATHELFGGERRQHQVAIKAARRIDCSMASARVVGIFVDLNRMRS